MFKYKKNLGQNFLFDYNIIQKIINILNINKSDIILEIGSGYGNVSMYLINVKKLILIEIDKNLFKELKKKFCSHLNIDIYNDDFLKFNIKNIIINYKKIRIIGNIPYRISNKIFIFLIKYYKNTFDISLIVQKDVVVKFFIKKKITGWLYFFLTYSFKLLNMFDINPISFYPKPKVMSSFIRIAPNKIYFLLNLNCSKKFLKYLFTQKRKKIIFIYPKIILFKKYFDLSKRPEEITMCEYIRFLNLIYITHIF